MADDTFSPGDFDEVLRRADEALDNGVPKDKVESDVLTYLANNGYTKFRTLGAVRRANLAEGGEGGFVRGVAQGATFGLADEGVGIWEGIKALAPGGVTPGEAYREGQQRSQAGVERFRREHPVQAGLSEVAGGLLVPGLGTVGLARAGAPVFRGLSSASRLARAGSGGLLGTAGATAHLAGEAEPGFRSRVSAGVPTWAGGEAPGWIHPFSAATGGVFSAASPMSRAAGGPTATQARVRGPLPFKLQSPLARSEGGKIRPRSPLAKVPEGEFFGRPQGQVTGEILAEQTGRGVIPPPRTATIPSAARPGPLPEPSGSLLPMRGAQGGTTDVAGEVGAVVNRAKAQREGLEAALEVDRQAVYAPLDNIYQTGWASKAASAGEEVVDRARVDARALMIFLKDNKLGRALTGGAVRSKADKSLVVKTANLLSAEIDEGLNPSVRGMQALRRSLRTIANKSGASDAAQDAFGQVEDIMRRMFPELEAADDIFRSSRQQLDGFNLGAQKSSKTLSFRNPDVNLSLGGSVDDLRHSIDEVMEIVKDTGGDLAQQKEVVGQFLDGVFHRTILAPLQTRQRTQVIKQLQEMMGPGGDRTWLRTFFERAPKPREAFEEFERQFARDIPAALNILKDAPPWLAKYLGKVGETGLFVGGLLGKGITKTPKFIGADPSGLLNMGFREPNSPR